MHFYHGPLWITDFECISSHNFLFLKFVWGCCHESPVSLLYSITFSWCLQALLSFLMSSQNELANVLSCYLTKTIVCSSHTACRCSSSRHWCVNVTLLLLRPVLKMKFSTHNVAMLEDGEAVEVKWSRLKFQVTHFFSDFQIFFLCLFYTTSLYYFIPQPFINIDHAPFIILYHTALWFLHSQLYLFLTFQNNEKPFFSLKDVVSSVFIQFFLKKLILQFSLKIQLFLVHPYIHRWFFFIGYQSLASSGILALLESSPNKEHRVWVACEQFKGRPNGHGYTWEENC